MAITHARPGELVDVQPFGPDLAGAITTTLIKTDGVEVVRIVM